jgi:transcriptional regulator with XRE-family HTH domain
MQNKVRQAREAAGMTALELAKLAGVSEMRVYSIERGRARVRSDEAARLGAVLVVTPELLFTEGGR